MKATQQQMLGMLDFEVQYRALDRETVTDPFVGLEWTINRVGIKSYTDAVREQMIHSPAMQEVYTEIERRGTRDALERSFGANGKRQKRRTAKRERVTLDDETIQAISDRAAGKDLDRRLMGEEGLELTARLLVVNITNAGGEPLGEVAYACADGHGNLEPGRCSACGKETKLTRKEIKYTPAVALRIFRMTDKVLEGRLKAEFGDEWCLDPDADKPTPLRLGEAMHKWVLETAEAIEGRLAAIGEDLEGNLPTGSPSN